MAEPSPLGPSPVESIRLVRRFQQTRQGAKFTATSLPGHLLHLTIRGKVEQTSNGRRQFVSPGTVVWYHEDEWVEGRVVAAPWIFYSVNFSAPGLPPPDFDRRLLPGRGRLEPLFKQLLAVWERGRGWERTFLGQAHLLRLLAEIYGHASVLPPVTVESRLWWEAEEWARANIHRPVALADLCAESGRSPNTIARACRAAVGMPPMKRLKQIRLSLARGLVRSSGLNITEIALRVGYARVHEFSRDYRKAFGIPPTAERGRS